MLMIKNNKYISKYRQLFFVKDFFLGKRYFFLSSQSQDKVETNYVKLYNWKLGQQKFAFKVLDTMERDVLKMLQNKSVRRPCKTKNHRLKHLEHFIGQTSEIKIILLDLPRISLDKEPDEVTDPIEFEVYDLLNFYKSRKCDLGIEALESLKLPIIMALRGKGYIRKAERDNIKSVLSKQCAYLRKTIRLEIPKIYKPPVK
jgi:hypothetical protein